MRVELVAMYAWSRWEAAVRKWASYSREQRRSNLFNFYISWELNFCIHLTKQFLRQKEQTTLVPCFFSCCKYKSYCNQLKFYWIKLPYSLQSNLQLTLRYTNLRTNWFWSLNKLFIITSLTRFPLQTNHACVSLGLCYPPTLATLERAFFNLQRIVLILVKLYWKALYIVASKSCWTVKSFELYQWPEDSICGSKTLQAACPICIWPFRYVSKIAKVKHTPQSFYTQLNIRKSFS